MPKVTFTRHLARHVATPTDEVAGGTVAEVLARVFETNPEARGYVLDDQGGLRKHVTVFVNGEPITDRSALTDPVPPDAEVYVMQALSGG